MVLSIDFHGDIIISCMASLFDLIIKSNYMCFGVHMELHYLLDKILSMAKEIRFSGL